MKNKNILVYGIVIATIAIVAALTFGRNNDAVTSSVSTDTATDSSSLFVSDSTRIRELEAQLKAIKDKEVEDERLGQYAINMMHRSKNGRSLSDGKKLVLARAIVRVSNDIFERLDHKHGFIAALSIESEFQRFVQSPTGPKGYSQVAKRSFHEAMERCGVKVNDTDDVWETDLNLYAGACYFRMMLEIPDVDNDPFIAIVAYNQGPNADAIKTFAKSGSLDNLEALKYVAKFTYLKRKNTDQVEVGVPAIKDLPTPSMTKDAKGAKTGLKATSKDVKVEAGK